MVGGGGTSLAVVVVWLSKDAWFAIVDTFLFPATKALSDPSSATIHDGIPATKALSDPSGATIHDGWRRRHTRNNFNTR